MCQQSPPPYIGKGLLTAFSIYFRNHDLGALVSKAERNRTTYPAAATGDYRDFVLQLHDSS
jgi:hypothetical protein